MEDTATNQNYEQSKCPNGWSAIPSLNGHGHTRNQERSIHNTNPLPNLQSLNLCSPSDQSPPNAMSSIVQLQRSQQPYQHNLPKPPHSNQEPPTTISSGMTHPNQCRHIQPAAVTLYSNQPSYNVPCSKISPHITQEAVTPYLNQCPYKALLCSNQSPHIPQPVVTSQSNQAYNSNTPALLPLKIGSPLVKPSPTPSSKQGPQDGVPPTCPSARYGVWNSAQSTPKQGTPSNSVPTMSSCLSQSEQSTHPDMFRGPTQVSPLSSGVVYSPVQASVYPTSPVQVQPRWAPPQQSYSHSGVVYSVDGTSMHQSGLFPGESDVSSIPSLESRYGLDPELLPSAVHVMEEDRAQWEGKVFVCEPDSSLPPLATTDCVMEDRGNSTPRFILATSYCFPVEGQLALQSHLPLGALITPLATIHKGERPLSVCMEADTVKGCGKCGAYMCSAMSWQDCGQRFYCPFCGTVSEVGWQHYHPTKGVQGNRLDRDKRPELSLGSYEILDNQQGDSAAGLLVAVDVSAGALRAGQLDVISQELSTLLTSLLREEGAVQSDVRVGLMTYDSRIHLYDLSPALSRPHMLVVTETEEMQLPVRDGLLVPLTDAIDSINSVLQRIPLFSAEGDESRDVLLELPVRAGLAILQAVGCPGQLLIFHSAPFTEGTQLHSSGFFSSNKPKSLFQPPEPAVSLAKECVSQGCSVHLFVFSQQSVGGAWPGHVPYLTGGALHCYHSLQGELDRERFCCELRRTVKTETGYRATLRVHVSKELRVSGCYGSFVPGPNPAQVTMATLNERSTLCVEFTHSNSLDEKRGVVIQTVLSYTSRQGERRTRVHSLTLRCSRHLLDTFLNCQAQTLLTFYCKKLYCAVLERPLQEIREELQTEVTAALAFYRKHCSSSSVSPGQLVLPQYLRALPVYVNSLRKSEVLLPGLRSTIHQRLQLRSQLVSMDTRNTARHFYPLLLPLHLGGKAVRCRAASLDPGCLYLVHGPLVLLLWVGHNVSNHSLVHIFNVTCLSALSSGETKLPVLDNSLSVNVRGRIESLNFQTPYTRQLRVVKEGDSCEEALQHLLVEDKSPNGGASYADFLYHLHVNSMRLLVNLTSL